MSNRKLSRVCLSLSTILFLASSLAAQSVTGSITGAVTDSSGGAVAGAAVTATNTKTGVAKQARTDARGIYTIPLLQPGAYNVRVEQAGFSTVEQNNLTVDVNQIVTANFTLQVGKVHQVVQVSGSMQSLLTTQAGTGQVLEPVQVQNLPLQNLDIFGLLPTMPGLVQVAKLGNAGNRNYFDSVFAVDGGRASTNEVLLDGVPDTIGDFNGIAIVPPPASVEEFKLQDGSYSAEFGRSGGGVVNMVTRSGGNALHGELYEYLQNSALNANGWQANRSGGKKVASRLNQFGGDVGGPVYIPHLYNGKNKTFFFFDYEGFRQTTPFSILTSVPSAAERTGDFSGLVNAAGKPITIFDPQTSTPIPGQSGQVARTAFAGNMIPASRMDPVAKAYLKYWPAPNLPGAATGNFNYGFNGAQPLTMDLYDGRIDHVVSSRQSIFGRYSHERRFNPAVDYLGTGGSPVNTVEDRFDNLAFGDTYTISPTLINDFRLGFTRAHPNQFPPTTGFDPTTLGFPAYIRNDSNLLVLPDIAVSGNTDFTSVGANGYNNQPRDTYSLYDSIIKVKGAHTLKMGFDAEKLDFNAFQIFDSAGAYSFNGSFTQGPNPTVSTSALTSGAGFADFLLGGYSSSDYQFQAPLTIYHYYYATYLQDDWKVTPKLTANLGMRWELETGTTEAFNRLTYFNFNAPSPLANATPAIAADYPNLRGLLSFTGKGNPRSEWNAPTTEFGPRVGLAYMLNKKTVLRGGYGIFYLPMSLEATGALGVNRDINQQQPNPFVPTITLSNPFPSGLPTVLGSSQGALTNMGLSIYAISRQVDAPYNQQWNVSVERSMPGNVSVQAAYVGSQGIHLPMEGLNADQAPPSVMALGSKLNSLVANPFYGTITTAGSVLANPTVTYLQTLLPFPQYTGVNWYLPNIGWSNYQSLQLTATKRYSQGLSFQASYVWSKELDLGGEGNGAAFEDPTSIQNVYNLAAEKSLSNQDIPSRFVASFVYELPYGHGRHFGSAISPVLNGVLGGWRVSGITTWQSGTPLALVANNVAAVGNAVERPNAVPGVNPAISLAQAEANVRSGKPWFNTAAFSIPAPFTFGDLSRTIGSVRTDSYKDVDFTLAKDFTLHENWKLSFMGEFFNIFNQTVFGSPNTNVNSTAFGLVTTQSNQPRVVQLVLKLNF